MKLSVSILIATVAADCYDGANGGCSHFCDSGVCSCPTCWTLDSDNATCIIETGRASVTCSTSGSSITVDKCVFPGVSDTGLTLNDANCFAVDHNNSTQWLIESGTVDGCGATLNYTDPEFIFQNTLNAEQGEENNIVTQRPVSVDFSCTYEGETSVSSTIKIDNTASVVTSFDINDVQQTPVPLGFNLEFYTGSDYASVADLSVDSTAVGNPIYGQLSPMATIPSTEFIANKCTVSDGSNSFDILNNCPNSVVNFSFGTSGQSDASAVQFQFNSFLFPNSTSGSYSIVCDLKVCQSSDTACLSGC